MDGFDKMFKWMALGSLIAALILCIVSFAGILIGFMDKSKFIITLVAAFLCLIIAAVCVNHHDRWS